ncbi:MAG: T9SS type A sorting domain-containing protein [Bacteroidetes bacterium]|nr:T9SS type A sorting domain-containing protein [Bacteroidota bacterium]
MKKILYTIVLGLLPVFCMAQIPNPDFELWQSKTKEMPLQWGIYGNTFKVPGYLSPNAVRIERDPQQPNAPGAVIYGRPDQNFSGGIAFNDRPDSVVVFLKKHLPNNDSAWFLVVMTRNGQTISNNNFKFSGTDTLNFVRLAFAIPYTDTGLADSLVIGISSTDPNSAFVGSYVVVDSLHFIGGKELKIPNGNFESWSSKVFDYPLGWFTSNENSQTSAGTLPVTKTTDAALHQFAIRIQNVKDGNQYRQGYIMAGRQGNNGPLPGFAVNGKDSLLYVHYKCFPKNGDEINIGVFMFDSGMMVGNGFLRQSLNITTWSQAPIRIEYFNGYTGTPDSAVIFCSAFAGGEEAKGESIVYVDGLKFNEPLTGISEINTSLGLLQIYPNPGRGIFNLDIPAYFEQDLIIQIFNAQGQSVYIKKIHQSEIGRQNLQVDLSSMSAGAYTVHLQIGSYSISKIIVIE